MKKGKRVAVVTGAASGIGLALTRACLNEDMHVVMVDHAVTTLSTRLDELSETAKTELVGVACDVSQPSDMQHLAKQVFEQFNRVDLLVNNAGVSGPIAPLWAQPCERIRQVMDVNLYGVIHGVQAFFPLMFKQDFRSQALNIASFYGLCSGSQMGAYVMSKHALVALSESLYFDLKHFDKPIDLSVACPSFVNTSLLDNSSPVHADKLHDMVSGFLKRSRPPEDVASDIMADLKKKIFYILPDKEIKSDCELRAQSIVNQTQPHEHSLEKLMSALSKRSMATG